MAGKQDQARVLEGQSPQPVPDVYVLGHSQMLEMKYKAERASLQGKQSKAKNELEILYQNPRKGEKLESSL